MGKYSNHQRIGRRHLLKVGAAGALMMGLGRPSWSVQAADDAATTLTPDEAIARLIAGNETFVSHPDLCAIELEDQRTAVAGHQSPWATIISCADSRVPPELIFGGHGLGELFVARNAGNLVDTATLGTVEYGAAVLGSPLIVVLAHTSCGAVHAACEIVTANARYPGAIGPMIEPIVPAAIAVQNDPGDFFNNTAKESALRTTDRLTVASSLIAGMVDEGKVKIIAAIYDLETGIVTPLD